MFKWTCRKGHVNRSQDASAKQFRSAAAERASGSICRMGHVASFGSGSGPLRIAARGTERRGASLAVALGRAAQAALDRRTPPSRERRSRALRDCETTGPRGAAVREGEERITPAPTSRRKGLRCIPAPRRRTHDSRGRMRRDRQSPRRDAPGALAFARGSAAASSRSASCTSSRTGRHAQASRRDPTQ